MIISNPLFDEFYGPSIPIHILEEERTKRDHADYIKQIEMLFTINAHSHNPTNDNTNVESFSLFQIPNQVSEPHQEEIDVVSETNDVLPPSDDDSDDEVDVDGNVIQNSEHEYSESKDNDLDNPLLPLPPPEPPDKEFDFEIEFEKEILVEKNLIVKFEYPVISRWDGTFICILVNSVEIVIFHPLSLRTIEFRDRVEPTTRIISRRLKNSCVGYCPVFKIFASFA
nr:hypothetical protein [Tanacetum cinerariifolium]